jgi:hypothetical protein
MSISRAFAVNHVFGLIILIGSQAGAFAEDSQATSFREMYFAAEKQFCERLKNIRIECRDRRARDSFDHKSMIYVLGESRVSVTNYLTDDPEKSKTPGRLFGMVHGNNADYGFLLHQPRKSGPYVLKNLHKAALDDPEFRDNIRGHVDRVTFAPFCLNEGIPLSEVLTDPAVELTGVRSIDADGHRNDELIEVSFRRKHNSKTPSPRIAAWSGVVHLNPKKNWHIEWFNVAWRPPEEQPGWYITANFEYKIWDCGIEFPTTIHLGYSLTPDAVPTPLHQTTIGLIETNNVPEHVFRLSTYGISEPVIAEPGGRTNLFLILLGIGSLLAFLLAAFLRKRMGSPV